MFYDRDRGTELQLEDNHILLLANNGLAMAFRWYGHYRSRSSRREHGALFAPLKVHTVPNHIACLMRSALFHRQAQVL